MKAFLLALIVLLLLLIGGGVFLLQSGWYNVAATDDYGVVEEWILEAAKRGSVAARTAEIEPPALADREALLRGAAGYDAMCATCHGAPGIERSAMGSGLNPQPPSPDEMLEDWSPAEMFWIIRNGIRMTGMPAWGETHSEESIWEIVGFLQEIEGMTPEEYTAIIEEAPDHVHGAQGHDDTN